MVNLYDMVDDRETMRHTELGLGHLSAYVVPVPNPQKVNWMQDLCNREIG
jgi:hypothetical protein